MNRPDIRMAFVLTVQVMLLLTAIYLLVSGGYDRGFKSGYNEGRKAVMIECVDRGNGIALDCP